MTYRQSQIQIGRRGILDLAEKTSDVDVFIREAVCGFAGPVGTVGDCDHGRGGPCAGVAELFALAFKVRSEGKREVPIDGEPRNIEFMAHIASLRLKIGAHSALQRIAGIVAGIVIEFGIEGKAG